MSRQIQCHIRCRFRHRIFDDHKHDRSSIEKSYGFISKPSILGPAALRNKSYLRI